MVMVGSSVPSAAQVTNILSLTRKVGMPHVFFSMAAGKPRQIRRISVRTSS